MKPDEAHTLHFVENERGDDPVAELDDDTPVFPDRDSPKEIKAGQTWRAHVQRKGDVGFAYPLERVDGPTNEPSPDEDAIQAFLGTQAGEQLADAVADRLRDQLKDEVAAETKGRLTKIEQRLSTLSEKLGELKVDYRRAGAGEDIRPTDTPEKPTLAEGEEPDEAFIARKILHQLYTLDKWKHTHTSGEKFAQGYLNGVPDAEIQAVVDELVANNVLLAHGKRPDEEYSLNPDRAADIYQVLGIDRDHDSNHDREAEPDTAASADAGEPGSTDNGEASPTHGDEAPWVEEGTFENTIRSLREDLDALRSSRNRQGGLSKGAKRKLEAIDDRVGELEGRASGLQAQLTKLGARVEDIQQEIANGHAEEDKSSSSKREETKDEGHSRDEGPDRPHHHVEADTAAAVPAIMATLGREADLEAVREFVYTPREQGDLSPLPSTQFGVGEPGTCIAEDCEADATVPVPAYDVTPGDPRMLAAPACEHHANPAPIVVYVEGDLDRQNREEALENLHVGRDIYDLPETKRPLTTNVVQFRGNKEARKHWNLAARKGDRHEEGRVGL